MTLPRCGTLLTYGKAEVIRIFRSPSLGRMGSVAAIVSGGGGDVERGRNNGGA
jgi:hypothetical protein